MFDELVSRVLEDYCERFKKPISRISPYSFFIGWNREIKVIVRGEVSVVWRSAFQHFSLGDPQLVERVDAYVQQGLRSWP